MEPSRSGRGDVVRKALLGILLILLPSVCLLLAVPLMGVLGSELLSAIRSPGKANSTLLLFSVVVAAAVLAVPGYLVAAFEEKRLATFASPGRWWVRASLGAGVVAALVATPLTFFFASWLWIFPVGTFVACLALWYRSEERWKSAAAG